MNTFGWDQMAYWWDEKQGDEGDLWHRALIDPPLLRLTGEVRGMHVLDLGCGNGYLSRRFARQGAMVTAVDANAPLIERIRTREAQEPLGITYHVAEAAHLEMLEDSAFDLAVCNRALMDIENAAGAIQEVSRVLKSRGRFVASISHPCFDKVNTSGWVMRRIKHDGSCAFRNVIFYFLPVYCIIRKCKLNTDSFGTVQLNCRNIGIVCRFKDNHFISWL